MSIPFNLAVGGGKQNSTTTRKFEEQCCSQRTTQAFIRIKTSVGQCLWDELGGKPSAPGPRTRQPIKQSINV